ncbi:hypothetical protein BaRGS_00028617 [Batillaria attramentaria]|uniref:Uncharacterized protein n=1 Tax=Batillaria attramentaria TaxID=370345 RepID=A0ABD0JZY0_9CAEN
MQIARKRACYLASRRTDAAIMVGLQIPLMTRKFGSLILLSCDPLFKLSGGRTDGKTESASDHCLQGSVDSRTGETRENRARTAKMAEPGEMGYSRASPAKGAGIAEPREPGYPS